MFSKDADRLCVIFNKNPWQNEPELKFDRSPFKNLKLRNREMGQFAMRCKTIEGNKLGASTKSQTQD